MNEFGEEKSFYVKIIISNEKIIWKELDILGPKLCLFMILVSEKSAARRHFKIIYRKRFMNERCNFETEWIFISLWEKFVTSFSRSN